MKNVLNFCSDEGKISILKIKNIGGVEFKTFKSPDGSGVKMRALTIITAHGPASENVHVVDFKDTEDHERPPQCVTVTPEAFDVIYNTIDEYLKSEPQTWMALTPKAGDGVERVGIVMRRAGIIKIVHDPVEFAVYYVTDLGFTIKLDSMTTAEAQASINDWLAYDGEVNQLIYPSEEERATMTFKTREIPGNIFDRLRDLTKDFAKEMEEDPTQFDDEEDGGLLAGDDLGKILN